MVEIEEEDDEIDKIVETNDMQKSGKRYPHCFYTQVVWFIDWNAFIARGGGNGFNSRI